MASELLLRALLASMAATALVLLLRSALRQLGGALTAYAAWAVVPACMLAALLPSAQAPLALQLPLLPGAHAAAPAAAPMQAAAWPWREAALALWLAGAMAMAAWLGWRQWRAVRHLPRRRVARCGAPLSGPQLVGVWRARLVLPVDFRVGYSRAERRLVLAHERLHAERGDLWANAACTLLQCLAWCNPLIHVAAARFRLDQELACDEAVLRRHGQAATYGRALLKAQLAAQGIPLACQWQAAHPLKERIVNLTATVSPARRLAGKLAATALLAAASLTAWGAQEAAQAASPSYLVSLHIGDSNPRVLLHAGEAGEVALGQGDEQWRVRMTVTPQDGKAQLKAVFTHGGKHVDDYTITTPLGLESVIVATDKGQEFSARLRVVEKTGS